MWCKGKEVWVCVVPTLSVVLSLHLYLQDGTVAETGWKLVHGVVFRHPNHPMRLWVFLGLGIQIFCMVLIMLSEGEGGGCEVEG